MNNIVKSTASAICVLGLVGCGGGDSKNYSIGGTVTGLVGSVVLQDHGGDNLTITANGKFTFATNVGRGNAYSVTIFTQPSQQKCAITNGSGNATANVTNVSITCLSLKGGAVQVGPLALVPTVSTFAGAAMFSTPNAITSDGINLYVVDNGNNVIRQIVIAIGAVTTLAGSGVAGSTDGTGTAATFDFITGVTNGITTDGTNLYVAENFSAVIRKVVIATGAVTTIAGQAGNFNTTDGIGTAALFNNPVGITNDGTNLYVVDNTSNNVRKIVISTNDVTTFAGSSTGSLDESIGTMASFNSPTDITTDGTNLYVVDNGNNKIRQIVIATGAVSSLTGSANTPVTAGAVDGSGTAVTFNLPSGITTDGTNLYVTDTGNNKIRKIVIATGAVSSLTGTASTLVTAGAVDGAGSGASFNSPYGITTDGTSLYIADQNNSTIRKIQ